MPQNQDEQPYPEQQQYGSGPGAPQRSSGDSERGRPYPPKPAGPYAPQTPPARSAGTYPSQRMQGAAGPYPPQQPPVAGGSFAQQPAPRQHSPAPANSPLQQRPPEQLFLGAPPRVKPPPEAGQVVRHARSRSAAAMLFNVSPEAEESMGMIDYALIAMVIFLLIAIIVVF